jgi:hypothetical protein
MPARTRQPAKIGKAVETRRGISMRRPDPASTGVGDAAQLQIRDDILGAREERSHPARR